MNYINYAKHVLYTPDTYHRRFDLDLEHKDNEPSWQNQAKRVALAALPYVSLYRPAGSLISVGMGVYRAISHLSSAIDSESNLDWKNVASQIFQTALAVLSVASTIFNFTLGVAITTSIDTLQGVNNTYQLLLQGEYRKALEEVLQTSASATYLAFMAIGALEMMVAFTLLQAATCFLQGQADIAQGRYLEGLAKIGMGWVRLGQTKQYIDQIERRNRLFAMQKYAGFIQRALKARAVRHLIENPLSNLNDTIDQQNENTSMEDLDFAAYFHGHGKELVKGANLSFRTKIIDGKEITELDFKVNHVFREKIEETINDFSKLKSREISELLELAQSHAKGIRIEKNQELPLGNGSMGDATKITIDGLGSILIGSSSELPTMYDRVIVRMDSDKNLYDFHELMAFLDVDQALHVSSKDDIDRLKMGHLFRIFFPRQATPFERSNEFFDLPIDQLKEKMIEKAPEMEKIFDEYYNQMTPEEILPGKMRYRVNGLGNTAYEHGARGLTAAITGAYSDKELFQRIASILKTGMLSSETRAQSGMNVFGMSSDIDFYTGGADSVFTQMITEKNCREGMAFSELYYNSRARFLISLNALETGTYQYSSDSFGNRLMDDDFWWGEGYTSRPSTLELVDNLQNSPWLLPGHEIMIKERVAPSLFTGIAVSNNQTRDNLLAYLKSQDLVQLDGKGQETILGIATDRFVQVARFASEQLFT